MKQIIIPKQFLSAMRPPQNCKEQLCLHLLRKINSKIIFVCICICYEMHNQFENNFSLSVMPFGRTVNGNGADDGAPWALVCCSPGMCCDCQPVARRKVNRSVSDSSHKHTTSWLQMTDGLCHQQKKLASHPKGAVHKGGEARPKLQD